MLKIRRLIKSFIYASHGLRGVFKHEYNFRVELLVALLAIGLAWWLDFNYLEWVLLLLVCGLVLLMEVMNSVVEMVSDALKPKLDTYVKQVKDMAAAAVFLSSALAIIVGLILFGYHLR